MSPRRLGQYERLLRRLRQRAFSDDGERIGALIGKVKAHCAADWNRRAASRAAEASQRFYFRTL